MSPEWGRQGAGTSGWCKGPPMQDQLGNPQCLLPSRLHMASQGPTRKICLDLHVLSKRSEPRGCKLPVEVITQPDRVKRDCFPLCYNLISLPRAFILNPVRRDHPTKWKGPVNVIPGSGCRKPPFSHYFKHDIPVPTAHHSSLVGIQPVPLGVSNICSSGSSCKALQSPRPNWLVAEFC